MVPELAGQHPDRQRKIPAQPGNLTDRGIPGAHPGPARQPGQQSRRVSGRQGVQADLGGTLQRRQPAAARDQHQAAGGAGQQRPDLLMPGRVIQQQQDLLARQVITPPARPGLQAGRDLRRGEPGGQQQAGQRIGGVDRPLSRGVGMQRQEKLPVREIAGQPVGGVHGEGGLADARHPIDRMDAHHAAVRGHGGQRLQQPGQLGLAAGESGDVTRQAPGGCRGEGARRIAVPGHQHLGGRGLATRRRHEQRTHRPGQAQRIGQQQRGVLVGGAVDTPLQVTDRPRAQARRFRQLLLRQPGLVPQPPQQNGETQLRLVGHRPASPHNLSAAASRHRAEPILHLQYAAPLSAAISRPAGQPAESRRRPPDPDPAETRSP